MLALPARRRPSGLILSEPCDGEIHAEIPLDPLSNRTGDHWHVRVDGLPEEFCYGYRVDGPKDNGHRYDPRIILIDPASRALSCGRPWGERGNLPRRSLMTESMIDRQRVVNPRTPLEDTIIYELHVRGYTIDPSSGVKHPGTYAGLVEKIDELKELGITAVELLPVDEFDENDCALRQSLDRRKAAELLGLQPDRSSALPRRPMPTILSDRARGKNSATMVDAFHEAGIEVYLDVVFNHTAEGGEDGPTYNFRGVDNTLFYMLDERGRYLNYSGCGNTFSSEHPVVRNFLLDCLRNWVTEGADRRLPVRSGLGAGPRPARQRAGRGAGHQADLRGFAAARHQVDRRALGCRRALSGRHVSRRGPLVGLERPLSRRRPAVLARRPGHDLGPGHATLRQRRPLPGPRPAAFDQLHLLSRRLHAQRPGLVQPQAQRGQRRGKPRRQRRQLELELRRRGADRPTRRAGDPRPPGPQPDGDPDGFAGRADDPGQGTSFSAPSTATTTPGARIIPSVGSTGRCSERNAGFLRFVRMMIALRKAHPVLRRRTFFTGERGGLPPEIVWHGIEPAKPDFSHDSRSLAWALDGRRSDRPNLVDRDIYVAMNAWSEPLGFKIPAAPSGRPWRRVVDTALPSPEDIVADDEGPRVSVLQALSRAAALDDHPRSPKANCQIETNDGKGHDDGVNDAQDGARCGQLTRPVRCALGH